MSGGRGPKEDEPRDRTADTVRKGVGDSGRNNDKAVGVWRMAKGARRRERARKVAVGVPAAL